MRSLKQNLLKPFKCLPICLEMRWKNIKGEHWCFKHRLLVITEEWAEGLPTLGHFISEQTYIEQSIFAQVNHFCTAYVCVTGALHACNDKVAGWGCWLHAFVWMCVRVSSGEQKKHHHSRVVYTVASRFPLWLSKTSSQRNMTDIRMRTCARCRACAVHRAATNVRPARLLISSQWFKASWTVENHFLQLCLILYNLWQTVTQVHALWAS